MNKENRLRKYESGEIGTAEVMPFEAKQAEIFLKTLFSRCTDGLIEIRCLPSGRQVWIPLNEIQYKGPMDSENLFVGVGHQRKGKRHQGRHRPDPSGVGGSRFQGYP